MKISKERADAVRKLFSEIDQERLKNHINAVIATGKSQDLNKRVRWDMLYYSCSLANINLNDWYKEGINDSHIDTMLRQVMKDLDLNKLIPAPVKKD